MISIPLTPDRHPILMLSIGEVEDRLDLHLTLPLTSHVMTGELFSPQYSASSGPGIIPTSTIELKSEFSELMYIKNLFHL